MSKKETYVVINGIRYDILENKNASSAAEDYATCSMCAFTNNLNKLYLCKLSPYVGFSCCGDFYFQKHKEK